MLGIAVLTIMTGGLIWLIRQDIQDQIKEEEVNLKAINILRRQPGHPECTKTTVYLVRHGEDGILRCEGELTEKGKKQAKDAGLGLNKILRPGSPIVLLSGSAPRCVKTAEIIGEIINSNVVVVPEISYLVKATLIILRRTQRQNINSVIVAVTHEPLIREIADDADQGVDAFIENGSIWPIEISLS
jgi:phosphohistidine phosphatase SixA